MTHRKFTEVLEEYLTERDRQNGDYYEGRYFGDRAGGWCRMEDLAIELDKMVQAVSADESQKEGE